MANKRFMAVLLAGLLAMAVAREAIAWQVTELTSSNETEITIQLRIWQDVSNADRLWLSARAPGDHWGAFGTIPLTTELRGYYEEKREFWMAEATIAEVGLRIWQRKLEPDRIWVQTCASPCNGLERGHRVDDWVPLGKNEMPLDDGLSTSGRYRYGDTATTVPRGNPGLLEDREHLLALRDVFRAEPPLDWEAATPTSHWEGVTLGGTPPRVQGLNLSNRGLAGEIWGYLGDLTELRYLSLDGNVLTGMLPSKMQFLNQLQLLQLKGNQLEGCLAPGLWRATEHDLTSLGLPECSRPNGGYPIFPSYACSTEECELAAYASPGTHFLIYAHSYARRVAALVYDVPPGERVRAENWFDDKPYSCDLGPDYDPKSPFEDCEPAGFALRRASNAEDVWLFVDWRFDQRVRNSYSGCVYDCVESYSDAAWEERLSASIWEHELVEPPYVDYAPPRHYQLHELLWIWP